ncbi:MAG: P22 coat protein [Lachnospiraceae bacterium]|nr:P22 coat protein [Lachnospiraceae bacterium]
MPNTILTPQIIANEALMVLEANLTMAGLVHRDYSDEFVNVGDTITVRKPAKFVAQNFTGKVNVQDITEGSIPVKMDRHRDVTVHVTSKQMTLDIKDFSSQVVAPAMQAIAQAIDVDLLAVGIEKAGKTVTSDTAATDLKDIANLGKAFDLNKAPAAGRRLALHPTHKYRYAVTDNLSKVSFAGDSQTLREAELGKVYGFDTFMSQNCPDTCAETPGTAKTAKVTATKGAAKVSLSSVTAATATIKAGDAFLVDGYMYRFMADGTAASGAITDIAIDQPIHKDFDAVDVILVKEPNSLAFHRNGIALVTRNLELPMGAAKAAIASANGLGVRVVYDYDSETKTDAVSFDIIYGITELDNNLLAKLQG